MVLESIAFGLIAATGLGVSDVIAALLVRRYGVQRTVLSIQIIAVVVFSFYLPVESGLGSITTTQWLQLIVLSVMLFGFYVGLYKALQLGPVAIISPILAAHTAIVVTLAVVFLDENLGIWQFVGVAATIGGVILASVDLRAMGGKQNLVSLGVMLSIGISIGAGVWQFGIGALSQEMGWFLPMYLSKVFMLLMIAPVAVARRAWPWQGMTRFVGVAVVAVALLETGSNFAFARGAEIGMVSIVGAAATAYPVVPMLGGVFLFKESLAPNQILGVAILVAGLLAMALA
ncbi:MAG: DMT family transporter [SAR202 cluster bacterium]|jgi:drug/metabolite transporter (DMT)-like permease|nr:DMT family transporter [SAR202 cluster bacterium]MDP6299847.1 DMT family transporter [SAR202 cluster bacterium]MDP7223912.1 DMT family transporter [SAR202 cluster bacterium]MDP7413232.1 DMT family transporter [SAR202 cluster bacterium]HJO82721.1 DMT family transporter [SAR202 cluster bacterium]|tara:strand:+ start:12719 stop:13582 length:864 start_codon:yes stop_codon:yes gene_type:complete